MYCITKIEEQKKDPSRSSVFVNGVFEFGIGTKTLRQYGIVEGMRLEEEAYEQLMEKIQLEKAKYRVMDYLARGNKTEKQVYDKLVDWEYSLSIAQKVMTFLKTYHYVDDERYMRQYSQSKLTYGKKSLRQIQSLLYAKGIKKMEFTEEEKKNYRLIEEENVAHFLQKYGYHTDLEREKKQKIISKIMGRGFNYSQIEKAIRKQEETSVE